MNTLSILIVLPLLVVFSYIFDAIARKTKFPSVILLMFTGIIVRVGTNLYGFTEFEFLDQLIPVLGTVGLILIVLEGALELDIKKEKLPVILKGFFAAAFILILNIIAVAWVLKNLFNMEHKTAVIFAIPLAIISSAVAIPSAAGLLEQEKEFVVYESTFSDILGIMIFNYAIRQFESNLDLISPESMISLGLQIIGVIVVSLFITYLLFQLLQKIEHHVKFFLILALLVLVYAFGKLFHLPALVTIFIFGLFLSNVQVLLPGFMKKYLDLNQTEKGLHEFHILTAESTFLVKTFFFLFFGFSISLTQFNSLNPFLIGLMIFIIMLIIRYIYFTVSTFKITPSSLVYISPRGLISILLFLQIKEVKFIDLSKTIIDERVLLVVILLSMMIMTLGTMKKTVDKDETDFLENTEEANTNSLDKFLDEIANEKDDLT
ncbi:MAG: cation:proton antiporter [Flavobacteriaceae bacterium]|nr:cation:proton antiporter [Flavobacteriaceae bacterium]